jgi:hypothetical protein
MTYHERVAAVMARSFAAGTYNTYEQILTALLARMPDENELRAYVAGLEDKARKMGAPDDFKLVQE